MGDHAIATTDELSGGGRVIASVEGVEVAVFEVRGEYRAFANYCAHQGGPLCEGRLTGTVAATYDRETLSASREWVKEGEVIACPWHQWEFDLDTGECLSRPDVGLPSYPVRVEDGEVIVSV